MSIFKESFRKYVRDQFTTRQKVISKGNSDKNSKSRLEGGPDGLAPGAFYSYSQKQCVIRLSSLVDLMEDVGLDIGGSKFESYKGETFARNFILEGGVLSDYSRNDGNEDSQTSYNQATRKFEEVRGGFPSTNKKINLSYGDPSLASDPRGGDDGYGAVPMPGIVDATVDTKSAYGSLRSAKVNFVCHNLRQLEILELLYMRPGYPLLMEWGWSPYISNKGEIINTFDSLSDNDWFWNDDDEKMNQQEIQEAIILNKKKSGGNYDGFIGFITNFSYTARPDGGFECTTELISMGEVIDSLKIPGMNDSHIAVANSISEEEEETQQKAALYQSALGILVNDIHLHVGGYTLQEFLDKDGTGYMITDWLTGAEIDAAAALKAQEESAYISSQNIAAVIPPEQMSESFILKSQIITKTTNTSNEALQTKLGYIRWDAFAALLNKYVIPTNEKGSKPLRIETNLYRSGEDKDFLFDPILYCDYENGYSEMMDVSCSPKVCILPHQFEEFANDEMNLTIGQRIVLFHYGLTFRKWKYIKTAISRDATDEDVALPESFNDIFSDSQPIGDQPDFKVNSEIAKRRIGGIYIGADFIKNTFIDTFLGQKEATLGDFLKNLWDKINEECPMHNFAVRVDDEFTNVIQVIDLPISTNDLKDLDYDSLFKFNVHSNDTIVRNFGYDTSIPNALKATIAINAQSGTSADDIDSVTFAAFNQSIKSRLSSLSSKFSDNERINIENLHHKKIFKIDRLRELQKIIFKYNTVFFNLIDSNENDDYETIYGNIKGIIKEAQTLEIYLEKSHSGYLKNQAIIPINLSLEIDGISGIVIGNVFKVDETRLPIAYRKRRVAFVALGEKQTITSGQDWTTTIRGQIILFPALGARSTFTTNLEFPPVVERVAATDTRVNVQNRNNAQSYYAESTRVEMSADEVAIRRNLGLDDDNWEEGLGTGSPRDFDNAEESLIGRFFAEGDVGEGYTKPTDQPLRLYDYYIREKTDGNFDVAIIMKSAGDDLGLIVDLGTMPPGLSPYDTEGWLLNATRFLIY